MKVGRGGENSARSQRLEGRESRRGHRGQLFLPVAQVVTPLELQVFFQGPDARARMGAGPQETQWAETVRLVPRVGQEGHFPAKSHFPCGAHFSGRQGTRATFAHHLYRLNIKILN